MRIVYPLIALTLGWPAVLRAQLPHACQLLLNKPSLINPFVDSVRQEVFAGSFRLTLVAAKGPGRGQVAIGTLHLDSVPSDTVILRYPYQRFVLTGYTAISLSTVRAVVAAPGPAPAGALLVRISMGRDGQRVGGGVGQANPDVGHENGMGLAYTGWTDSVIAGTWRSISYSPRYVAEGPLCLERVATP